MKTETRTIKTIERLNSSVNSNPRYAFTFGNGSRAILSSDAAVGYEIGNPGYREGDTVEVGFTRAGRVATMEPADPRALTHDDQVAVYQLEKLDQGGDVMGMCEEQMYAVASSLGLEVDDDEESPGFLALKLGNDRWASIYLKTTVFDRQGDLEARVFIAQQHLAVADCPAELEVESTAILGAFSDEESAWQALAEDAAEALADLEQDGEGIDQAIEYMEEEYRWSISEQPVLS